MLPWYIDWERYLAVDVHRVEVVRLHHVGAHQHSDWLIAGQTLCNKTMQKTRKMVSANILHLLLYKESSKFSSDLKESALWVKAHDCVVVQITWQWQFVDLDRSLNIPQ